MGRPPSNGGPAFRFTPNEVIYLRMGFGSYACVYMNFCMPFTSNFEFGGEDFKWIALFMNYVVFDFLGFSVSPF